MEHRTHRGADDLLEDLLGRVDSIAQARADRVALLGSRRDELVLACREHRYGIVELDGAPAPNVPCAAVDGAHALEVDRGEAFSVSVCFALDDAGEQRSSACLAPLPHMVQMSDVSAGLMFMQEVILAVEAAEDDLSRPVLVDGSRLSTLVAIDAFYVSMSKFRPGTLEAWRQDDKSDAGRLLRTFEDQDWLVRYLGLPNLVGNTKLVTTRRLAGEVGKAFAPGDPIVAALRDMDDKSIANVVLAPAGGDFPGEAMGPFPSPPPCAPFGVRACDANGDGYPRSAELREAMDDLAGPSGPDGGPARTGFYSLYLNPTPSHGAFSVEVNRSFWASLACDALRAGRSGADDRTLLLRGLSALLREATPSVDVQEPYLVHVADRLCKRTIASAKGAYSYVLQAGAPAGLAWTLSRPHRTQP